MAYVLNGDGTVTVNGTATYNAEGWTPCTPGNSGELWAGSPVPVAAPDGFGLWSDYRTARTCATSEHTRTAEVDVLGTVTMRTSGTRVRVDREIDGVLHKHVLPPYQWAAEPFWHWHPDQDMVEGVKALRVSLGMPLPHADDL